MKICFKPYLKKNGELMLYINNNRGVSLGLSGSAPSYSKMTPGQKKLWEAAQDYMIKKAERFTGDLNNHHEPGFCAVRKVSQAFALAGTDVATIGGMSVGSDGSYVIAHGGIVECSVWVDASC
jgi:hypothetical protein